MRTATLATVFGVLTVSFSASAATIQATSFSSAHAGTTADPWPGSALQAAIASANPGDVVVVSDGIWSVTSSLANTNSSFSLLGQSLNAKLVFSGSGQWVLGSMSALVNNVNITGLTFDASEASASALWIINCVNCSFTGNAVIGTNSPSLPALLFQGGANDKISANSLAPRGGECTLEAWEAGSCGGGNQLQINALAFCTALPVNTGYDVSDNHLDSVGIFTIGVSNVRIHDNTLTNTILGNHNSINFAAPYGGLSRVIQIDHNTLDGGQANSVTITGIPQDTGGQGSIEGLFITGNILKGTVASMYVTTFDTYCLANCTTVALTHDVVISNNFMQSYWAHSTIDLSGGGHGVVQNVTAMGNILMGTGSGSNAIAGDATTTNTNIVNNVL